MAQLAAHDRYAGKDVQLATPAQHETERFLLAGKVVVKRAPGETARSAAALPSPGRQSVKYRADSGRARRQLHDASTIGFTYEGHFVKGAKENGISADRNARF